MCFGTALETPNVTCRAPTNLAPMAPTVKLIVFVPTSHSNAVRTALGDAGAGRIGNYSHCSFSTQGVGRFLPEEGSRPHSGQLGNMQAIVEERIEVLCESSVASAAIEAMLSAHPYEKPAYELYSLLSIDDL